MVKMELALVFLTVLCLWPTTALSRDGCVNDSVRLVGGCGQTQGRVELCVSNQWGTVCDDFWSDQDANVVCGQLGFLKQGATALQHAQFGEGSGDIYLDNVRCTGNEQRLTDCPHNGLRVHDCDHDEDAGVICKLPLTCLNQTETAVPTTVMVTQTAVPTTVMVTQTAVPTTVPAVPTTVPVTQTAVPTAIPTTVTVTQTQSSTCSKTVQTVNKQCTVSPTGITTPMSTSSSEINIKCLTTNTAGLNEMINSTSTGVLGAFIGILLLIIVGLLLIIVGLTFIYMIQKIKCNKLEKTLVADGEEDRILQNPVYEETAGTVLTHESVPEENLFDSYKPISSTDEHAYDVISHQHVQTITVTPDPIN